MSRLLKMAGRPGRHAECLSSTSHVRSQMPDVVEAMQCSELLSEITQMLAQRLPSNERSVGENLL